MSVIISPTRKGSMRNYTRFNRGLARQYDKWMVAMHYAKVAKHMYRRTVRRFSEFLGKRSLASVTGHGDPPGRMAFVSAAVVIVVLLTGAAYFQRMETTIADVV
jgi:hypothetical protein